MSGDDFPDPIKILVGVFALALAAGCAVGYALARLWR